MPYDPDLLARRGLISPDAAAQQGLDLGDEETSQPSWADQAAKFAGRDPKELLKDPEYMKFVMGLATPLMARRSMLAPVEQAFRQAWAAGHSTTKMGQMFGVHPSVISGWAAKLDLPARAPPPATAKDPVFQMMHRRGYVDPRGAGDVGSQ